MGVVELVEVGRWEETELGLAEDLLCGLVLLVVAVVVLVFALIARFEGFTLFIVVLPVGVPAVIVSTLAAVELIIILLPLLLLEYNLLLLLSLVLNNNCLMAFLFGAVRGRGGSKAEPSRGFSCTWKGGRSPTPGLVLGEDNKCSEKKKNENRNLHKNL